MLMTLLTFVRLVRGEVSSRVDVKFIGQGLMLICLVTLSGGQKIRLSLARVCYLIQLLRRAPHANGLGCIFTRANCTPRRRALGSRCRN